MLSKTKISILEKYLHPDKGVLVQSLINSGAASGILIVFLQRAVTLPPAEFRECLDILHNGDNFHTILNLKKLNDICFNSKNEREYPAGLFPDMSKAELASEGGALLPCDFKELWEKAINPLRLLELAKKQMLEITIQRRCVIYF